MSLLVDTHAHIYSQDTETYPHSCAKPRLPRAGRGTIEDLKLEAEANQVDRVAPSTQINHASETTSD